MAPNTPNPTVPGPENPDDAPAPAPEPGATPNGAEGVEPASKVDEIKQQVIEWLLQFGIKPEFVRIPTEEEIAKASPDSRDFLRGLIIVPYNVPVADSDESLTLEADLVCTENWIQVKFLLMRGEDVPKSVRLDLYEHLLTANYNLNEVTFSLSNDKDVFVEADMPVSTTYDNFESEYGSVEYGTRYFLEKVLPLLQERMVLKNTYDARRAMYI